MKGSVSVGYAWSMFIIHLNPEPGMMETTLAFGTSKSPLQLHVLIVQQQQQADDMRTNRNEE
jgi:hypothetical protein